MIQIARDLGYEVVERDIARAELYLADEVFMTGTAAELVPVREIDDHAIGTGEPGEVTRALQSAFDDAIHGRSERYREWLDVVDVTGRDARRRGPVAERHCRRLGGSNGRRTALRRHPARRHAGRGHDAHRRGEAARRRTRSTRSASHLIEAGFPASNPKEAELFELLAASGSSTPRSPPSA